MSTITQHHIAIEFLNVVKKGRRTQLGPLNLQIPKGYVTAIVGPNGAGKSTMMQLMLQTIYSDAGSMSWYGGKANEALPLSLKQRIAYVPEAPIMEENLMTAEAAAGFRSHWYPSWDEEYFEALMTRFEVPRGERLNRMSKGERRKFEIAAALAARPKLLFLDEPTSGLDPFAWKGMIDEIRKCLEDEDVTIVIATHIVEEIKRLADYIVLVHKGQISGMAEKDALYGAWHEIWVRCADINLIRPKSGLVGCSEDGPSIWKLVVSDKHEIEERCREGRAQWIKSRALELDEIFELWIQGNKPSNKL